MSDDRHDDGPIKDKSDGGGWFFRRRRGLPAELVEAQAWIEGIARGYGLEFVETRFELCDWEEINMIASYGGFPVRYPHWRFGMEYLQMDKGYEYGLQKIYEMVINTDPSYAYLLDNNTMMDQKLVMAHVFGHVDFFTNNQWFAYTNRKMLDQMANHAARVRRYMDRQGVSTVETLIDMCLSIDNLIDPYHDHIRRVRKHSEGDIERASLSDGVYKLPAKAYMDSYVNPPEFIEAQKKRHADELQQMVRFPSSPDRDVMGFIMRHGHMASWMADVLGIIRDEAYYFAPQGQTKVMNEGWACLEGGTPVFTDVGVVAMSELVERGEGTVHDGEGRQGVYDRHVIPDHEVVEIRTRRGLRLKGSNNHRILTAGGAWRRLDELRTGDVVAVSGGGELWASELVELSWQLPQVTTLQDIAEDVGVSVSTVARHRAGRRVLAAAAIDVAMAGYDSQPIHPAVAHKRKPVDLPDHLDERLAAFLGYLVGDGHISRVKHHLGLTTGDADQADRFMELASDLFGTLCSLKLDGNRWRVLVHSETLSDFLQEVFGLLDGPSARHKTVPEAILRSPGPVVAAFLSAYFDCDAYAGKQGVILSTASERMSEQVQVLLLNFGILSRRRQQADGCWHVHIAGRSALTFEQAIGFSLARKQQALSDYLGDRQWFKAEQWTDEVVAIEHGRADVYDISVTETHRYAAGGFINHNSYWHTTMMTRNILDDSEVIDYADHHSGTVAMRPGNINPYKIGIELFRDIEDRWNKGQYGLDWDKCDDVATKRDWDTGAMQGREKIFEVRRTHNDVTFIDTFLTEDFVRKIGLFTYQYDKSAGHYVIESRDFQAIKQKLLFMLSNHGQPRLNVTDGNHANRGELELTHEHEGFDIKLAWASEVMENLAQLWGRPVHIVTRIEDKDTVLHHDGSEFKADGIALDKAEKKQQP